jgi:hypothetical protein
MGFRGHESIKSHPHTGQSQLKIKDGIMKNSMANIQRWKKEFPVLSLPRLIDCPLQLGNLKISQSACLKRYRVALNRNFENGTGKDVFTYFLNQGLLKCQ